MQVLLWDNRRRPRDGRGSLGVQRASKSRVLAPPEIQIRALDL